MPLLARETPETPESARESRRGGERDRDREEERERERDRDDLEVREVPMLLRLYRPVAPLRGFEFWETTLTLVSTLWTLDRRETSLIRDSEPRDLLVNAVEVAYDRVGDGGTTATASPEALRKRCSRELLLRDQEDLDCDLEDDLDCS